MLRVSRTGSLIYCCWVRVHILRLKSAGAIRVAKVHCLAAEEDLAPESKPRINDVRARERDGERQRERQGDR